MNLRLVSLAAATALACAPAGHAALGDGNVAGGSIGTVQVSSVTSEPAVTAATPVADVTVKVPVSLPGAGGNSATRSIGTAQAGGGHAADDSAGTVQAASTQAGPVARASAVTAAAPAAPVVTVAPSRPAASSGTTAPAPVAQVTVRPAATAAGADGGELTLALRSLWLQARSLGVSPGFSLTLPPVADIVVGGDIATGPRAGDETGSLLTGQVGSVTAAPTASLGSSTFATSVGFGGASGIDGTGANLADASLGTAQVGGPNTADGSTGTVQVGGVTVAPALRVSTPLGNLVLGGASGIEGGANRATDSLGTAQIGGGNTSNGSAGSLQAGAVSIAPTLALTGTPFGDVTLGGSTGIAGSGNTAGDSIGTVQVGGGNGADASNGTGQVGPVATSAAVMYGNTPAGSGTVGGPTQIGTDAGNTANGSSGTLQVGGGNGTSGTTGAVQVGGGRTLASTAGGGGTTAAATAAADSAAAAPGSPAIPSSPAAPQGAAFAGRRATGEAAAPKKQAGTGTFQPPLVTRVARVTGSLPFTGLNLALLLALGLSLLAAGLGVRSRARR
jgi:hypothetical protein